MDEEKCIENWHIFNGMDGETCECGEKSDNPLNF